MPKSNQSDKNSRSQSDITRFIEIDEGIFGPRISDRSSPEIMDGELDHILQKLEALNMILVDPDEDDEDYEEDDFDPEEFEPKIMAILGSENIEVNLRNQKKYLSYLSQSIDNKRCILTGNQEFAWEDYYIFGSGTPKEYEKQRKTEASFMDQFNFISFSPDISKSDGIMVKVERLSDGKLFTLPLWQLEPIETTTKNFELISDYVTWFEYYQD